MKNFKVIAIGAFALFTSAFVAQAADKVYFYGDIVRGIDRKKGPTGPVCVLASKYNRGEKVVWRARLHDPSKKEQMGKADIKSLHVVLPDGSKHAMKFGGHPPKKHTDYYWTAAWVIPASYPTGSFSYKLVAVDSAGKTHSWTPFNVKSSAFMIAAAGKK